MLSPFHKQGGVSLIELMIGLAIAAILLGLGMPGFQTFMSNSHIRNASEAIQNGLSLAKAEAVRRNTNVSLVLNGTSWTVECVTAVGDIEPLPAGDGIPDCPGTNPAATTPSYIQSRPQAEGSSRASVSPATATVTFTSLGRTTMAANATATFNISNPDGTCASSGGSMRCLRVVVTPAGQIRMCDPARPTNSTPPDPQAC